MWLLYDGFFSFAVVRQIFIQLQVQKIGNYKMGTHNSQ